MKYYNNWKSDLSDSVKAIYSIKDSTLKSLLKCSEIIPVEGINDYTLEKIDTIEGSDWKAVYNNFIVGIATRVQWTGNNDPYNTFTVRYERHTGSVTEFEKRWKSIKKNHDYPKVTVQAYFDNKTENNLISIASCKTVTLYDKIINGKYKYNKSDNGFLYVSWSCFEQNEINIICNIRSNKNQIELFT